MFFDVNIDVNTNLYLNITKSLLSHCILTHLDLDHNGFLGLAK